MKKKYIGLKKTVNLTEKAEIFTRGPDDDKNGNTVAVALAETDARYPGWSRQ